jgi:hypothetical protein
MREINLAAKYDGSRLLFIEKQVSHNRLFLTIWGG